MEDIYGADEEEIKLTKKVWKETKAECGETPTYRQAPNQSGWRGSSIEQGRIPWHGAEQGVRVRARVWFE